MTTSPRLGFTQLAAGQAVPETTVNEMAAYLEAATGHFIVLDRDLAAPPASPGQLDTYLVAASATGAWAGHDGEIAVFINTAWAFIAPVAGWIAFILDELGLAWFDGTAWNPLGLTLDNDTAMAADSAVAAPTQHAVIGYVASVALLAANLATAAQVRAGTAGKPVAADTLLAAMAVQPLTDGATVSWDLAAAINAKVTLAGNRTLAVSNPTQGATYSLAVVQDATGSRTLIWPASFDWGDAGAPTPTATAGKRDRITIFCTDAVTPKFDAFLSGKGFS